MSPRLPLAKCILNPSCAADLTCVIACSGRPDESTCQILGSVDRGLVPHNPCPIYGHFSRVHHRVVQGVPQGKGNIGGPRIPGETAFRVRCSPEGPPPRINCGNNFENDTVVEFNRCALSAKKCAFSAAPSCSLKLFHRTWIDW